MKTTRWRWIVTMSIVSAVYGVMAVGADRPSTPDANKEALSKLQGYVGGWRGIGQLRRGSSQGAWSEKANWSWQFSDGEAALTFQISDPKFFDSGKLVAADRTSKFELQTKADGKTLTYIGELDESGRLVLQATDVQPDKPARISIRQVAGGKRMLMLFERRVGSGRYVRMAEVGYTREGSNFGKGTNYVECVVTGGVGTMPVTFEGKTYYVCCSGCRDYFNDNPAEVMAEYRERKAAEKANSE